MRKSWLSLAAVVMLASCGDDDGGPTGPSAGKIQVALVMLGADTDSDGCTFAVDGGAARRLAPGESIGFTDLATGTHEVAIADVATNCHVDGSASRSVTVSAGQNARETFTVVCEWTTRIAFNSGRDGLPVGIWLMNPDGTGPARLASGGEPAWSPDGTRIAFSSGPYDGDLDNLEIYVMNADGTELVNLTNHPAWDDEPTWSPDGTRIAFESMRDGNWEIYVMGADGSNPVKLTNHPALDAEPAWSPDGTRIAFRTYRDGYNEIYVMNVDGTGQVNLTNHPNTDWEPTWSPDGTQIAFVSYRRRMWDIYAMSADGTGLVNLTNHQGGSLPAWSPYLY